MKTVTKPWGKEEWLELNDRYCYKRIYINAGYKTSYQYHNFKRETNFIIDGEAEVWLENDEGVVEKTIMRAGQFFNVIPPRKHRVIALTDIILQEVSTPEVDDVIRLEDDTLRHDGKIDSEHSTPAVLILTAGMGNRLGNLTKEINKALLPINNRAIISHIIDKFPKEYDFVVAIGYKGDSIKEYCEITHPHHKFTFVEIDNVNGIGSGPGYSALKCEPFLKRPFYITTCDCMIDSEIPHLDGNWLGVYPTSYPEKYSTVKVDDNQTITDFADKSERGFDLAFVGLAGIVDYSTFWLMLGSNMAHGEVVSAFKLPKVYSPEFKVKKVKWLDTGNLDDLTKTREYFNDVPLSLQKNNGEITYNDGGKFIKFCPDTDVLNNRVKRAHKLLTKIPTGFGYTEHFIYYNWVNAHTLYEWDNSEFSIKFLEELKSTIFNSPNIEGNPDYAKRFYVDKTQTRISAFLKKYGSGYMHNPHNVMGTDCDSMKTLLDTVDWDSLCLPKYYEMFHGDLQFDNILYNAASGKFNYIDWRESFAGNVEIGDLYYDLAKLYGGCLIPYNIMKDEDNITYKEGLFVVEYSYHTSYQLNQFREIYEKWLLSQGYDLQKIKLLTAIIYINMSPLHDEKFGKMLWFKAIEILNKLQDENKQGH